MSFHDDVGAFHAKFGLPNTESTAPRQLSREELFFRLRFLLEELAEFCGATGLPGVEDELSKLSLAVRNEEHAPTSDQDLLDAGDALVDLTYVALGTAHLMGLPFNEMWAEVQRANLAKERATGAADVRSVRGSALDVVKPAGWQPPDHAPLLARHAARFG